VADPLFCQSPIVSNPARFVELNADLPSESIDLALRLSLAEG
jgi:hypothetical protein